jgi:hypothetical protein
LSGSATNAGNISTDLSANETVTIAEPAPPAPTPTPVAPNVDSDVFKVNYDDQTHIMDFSWNILDAESAEVIISSTNALAGFDYSYKSDTVSGNWLVLIHLPPLSRISLMLIHKLKRLNMTGVSPM